MVEIICAGLEAQQRRAQHETALKNQRHLQQRALKLNLRRGPAP
jgi:hypothetical protein